MTDRLRDAATAALEMLTSERWGTVPYMDLSVYDEAEKVAESLRAALAEPAVNPWKDAVIEGLAVSWAITTENENDPVKAVNDLVESEVRIALDPSVSSEAQALIDKGRAMAEPATQSTHSADCYKWHHACAVARIERAEKVEPVAWMESPHGAIRANPNYKMVFPSQLLAWQIPLYAHPITPPAADTITRTFTREQHACGD